MNKSSVILAVETSSGHLVPHLYVTFTSLKIPDEGNLPTAYNQSKGFPAEEFSFPSKGIYSLKIPK